MQQLLFVILGPFTGVAVAFVALVVWRMRRRLRPAHVFVLVMLSALGLAGCYGALLAGLAGGLGSSGLVMVLMYASAALAVGCGSSVLFATVLLMSGHAEPAAASGVRPSRAVVRPEVGRSADDDETLPGEHTTPSPAELLSESARAGKRRAMWMSGLFLLIAMPAIAAAILYSMSKSIRSGFMAAMQVVNQANPAKAYDLSISAAPFAFGWQIFLLGAVAGLCLYFAWVAAFHLFTGFRHHPDYPHRENRSA